jgi:hypothetical protein
MEQFGGLDVCQSGTVDIQTGPLLQNGCLTFDPGSEMIIPVEWVAVLPET